MPGTSVAGGTPKRLDDESASGGGEPRTILPSAARTSGGAGRLTQAGERLHDPPLGLGEPALRIVETRPGQELQVVGPIPGGDGAGAGGAHDRREGVRFFT